MSVGGEVPARHTPQCCGGICRPGSGRCQEHEGGHQGEERLRPPLRGKHQHCQAPGHSVLAIGIEIKLHHTIKILLLNEFLCFSFQTQVTGYKLFPIETI